MVEQLDKDSFRLACVALRTAIVRRANGDQESLHAPLRALTGLEHAALNAPHNEGWLRKRRIELRNALDGLAKHALSEADELRFLYDDIAAILRREPRGCAPVRTKGGFVPARFWVPNDVW